MLSNNGCEKPGRVVGDAIDPDPEGLHTDTVRDLEEAYVSFVASSSAPSRIYLELAVGGALADRALHERLVGHHERRVQRFADATRRDPAADHGDEEAAAELMLVGLNGLACRWVLEPGFDFRGHARRLLEGASPTG